MQQGMYAFQSQVSAGNTFLLTYKSLINNFLAHYVINKKFTQDEKCTIRYVKTIFRVDKLVYLGVHRNSSYLEHYKIGSVIIIFHEVVTFRK